MDFTLPALRREELVTLRLRALFEAQGYSLYRLGSFEEYDLYLQNKSFLSGEDAITFSSVDGRLLALKPDATLSIVKNTPAGETRRVYYTENVFRRDRQTGEYREISQMGLEFIGGEGAPAEIQVLRLAIASLAMCGQAALDLSHMGFVEAIMTPFADEQIRREALEALWDKSPHAMRGAAQQAGLSQQQSDALESLVALSGSFEEAFPKAQVLAAEIPEALVPLQELAKLYREIKSEGVDIRLDFSVRGDADYYNGLIFQGFVVGAVRSVLAGGRYDNLLRRFEKSQGALGFALYLDELGRENATGQMVAPEERYLNIALPKGRLGNQVYKLFDQVGFSCPEVLEESRKLIFEDAQNKVRYFLVKPSDVDIYVEHGAADIGVVGKDVLLESGADVLELLDLGLGRCRLAVAGPVAFAEDMALPLRVATKYPAVARKYYAKRSRSIELIQLHGSIELAPLLDLSDVIVDIVETGSTLKENNLAVLAEVAPSSARLIANRASWRFKGDIIERLVLSLEEGIC